MTDWTGALVATAGREEAVVFGTLGLGAAHEARRSWGVFRNCRPVLYGRLAAI